MMETDVLIVGAGPTGLMLANLLGRRGVRVTIIDRHSGPAQQSRAMAVHARTLEIYAQLGIARQAIDLGTPGAGANMWAQGRRMARVPIGDIGRGLSPYPFVLMLGQDDNERILGDSLRRCGLSVEWNTELTNLDQHRDHVIATITQADGAQRTIRAAWVAGCDGARSSVREQCGITFRGEAYQHVFFVADTVARGNMVPNEVNVYLWKDGFHLFFPMRAKDGWRVIGILPAALHSRSNLSFDDVIPSVQQEAGSQLQFQHCHWFSTYRIHHRAAERFRHSRCFLLGDAAHVHSPVGGQGMNTGLQDAYNLAWKLALVVKGDAGEALLDSYEAERLPVAKRLLDTTDRGFQFVVANTWSARMFRTKILARMLAQAMKRERVRQLAFRTLSQIGISYPKSQLSETLPGLGHGAPVAGDRFPWLNVRLTKNGPLQDVFQTLDDAHFHLVAIGQPAPAVSKLGLGDRVRTHVIISDPINDRELTRFNIPPVSFYLVRPDGYIGMAGIRLDASAVRRYFEARQFRVRANSSSEPTGQLEGSLGRRNDLEMSPTR
jgi:2-polyprenyl-6-methoxyphenol hydroxylase-like FAD-dependent oxidoreductase